ncbi:oviduct-specific glycoprotein-like [Hydractinia symbiolongicarpus]|uniref:oviduct-specific glycoprotein-like n=1 Tax=Hydractinia symbiolongicarpus TaxID=13093 RepID=UPI00254B04B4|nr:oviduct-specific glycoprotein-like [Hydractinia symbiolongicarpus]
MKLDMKVNLCEFIFLHVLLISATAEYVRVCYYTNWAHYRSGIAKFTPQNIDPFLCTHIVYAFAKIVAGPMLSPYEENDAALANYYQKVVDLKKVNPSLKVLLAVGGWTHEGGSYSPFSNMVQLSSTRKTFIANTIAYLRKYNFDGLDLDWEYPAASGRNSPPGDREKFTMLCQELKEAFQGEFLLTAAVSASSKKVPTYYETNKLGVYLDALHLMSYDLHGSWESKTGHHTSMDESDELSVTNGVDVWINGGFPSTKIALGLGNYGRSFQLSTSGSYIGASSNGAGLGGKHTAEDGLLAYYEICEKIKMGGMTVIESNSAHAPYAYKGNQWVGYDNEASMRCKVKTLIKGKNLLGAMFWALDLDDFSGQFCNAGKYPLMKAVKDELSNDVATTTTTPSTSISSTTSTSTSSATARTTTKSPSPPTSSTTTTKGQTISTSSSSTISSRSSCIAIGPWYQIAAEDEWCKTSCAAGSCPADHCSCDPKWKPWTHCRAIGGWSGQESVDQYCNEHCAIGNCPSSMCSCEGTSPVTTPTTTTTKGPTTKSLSSSPTTTTKGTTTKSPSPPTSSTTTTKGQTISTSSSSTISSGSSCIAIGPWYQIAAEDEWCKTSCAAGSCPADHCSCDPKWKPWTHCRAIGGWSGQESVDQYCNEHCAIGNCPSSMCSCEGTSPVTTPTTTTTKGPTTKSLSSSPTTTTKGTTTKSPSPPTSSTTTTKGQTISTSSSSTISSGSSCIAIGPWYQIAAEDEWCKTSCAAGSCPADHCSCDPKWKPWTHCRAIGGWSGQESVDQYCNEHCAIGNCPSSMCSCEGTSPVTTPTTTTTPLPSESSCIAIGPWYQIAAEDELCKTSCAAGSCPTDHCSCDPNWKPWTHCRAIGGWSGQAVMDKYCNEHCSVGNCPIYKCSCSN